MVFLLIIKDVHLYEGENMQNIVWLRAGQPIKCILLKLRPSLLPRAEWPIKYQDFSDVYSIVIHLLNVIQLRSFTQTSLDVGST